MNKPVLRDFRNSKKITIPGIENSEVEIYDSVLYGETDTVRLAMLKPEDVDLAAGSLIKVIKSWNFVNEKDEPLPVNIETLKLLPANAITHIAQEFKDFVEGKKKATQVK